MQIVSRNTEGGTCITRFLGILILFFNSQESQAAITQCSNGDKFGERNPEDKLNTVGTNYNYGYMMGDSNYIVDCCGVVSGWEAYFNNVSGTRTIYFQVWRPTVGTTYALVGQNSMTVTTNGLNSINVNQGQRITVKPQDKWGWWSSGIDIITYKQGGGEEDDNYMMTLSSMSVGSTNDWNTSPVDDRSYAVRMDILANSNPTFTNLPSTVTIAAASITTGKSVYTVSFSDVDTFDVSSLSTSMASNSKFSFDTSTYIVATTSSLTKAQDVHTLLFTVTDQCGRSSTATLTVSVTNEPPVIINMPAYVSISEDATLETLLFTINATDPENSAVTCAMASSVPNSYPFFVRIVPLTTAYGIYSRSSPGFIYSALNQYDLTVDCTDGQYTDSDKLYVYLIQNIPPVFLNLQNSTTVSTMSSIGDRAFTVLVSDTDQLSFTMTCDPTTCPFRIFDSGAIQITEDLSSYNTVGYDLDITVSDGRNRVGPRTLTITLTNINDPVIITNLPSSISVVENTAVGTSLYQVSYSDVDTAQAHTFSMTSSPGSGMTYFAINSSSGVIKVSSSINFESIPATTYVLSVTVTDTVTSSIKSLTIVVANENEAPTFSQSSYTLSANEGTAGTVIGTPSFGVTDPDSGDTKTLTLNCGSETGYLMMNPSTGQVSYQSNYDLDTGNIATVVNCTVKVTDSGELTATAGLVIHISDVNDNTPVFSPKFYNFYVSYYAQAGTTVGTVTATDADRGRYGVITYSLNQSSLSVEYFAISSNGVITIKSSPSESLIGYSTVATLTSTASDVGGQSDTATVVIVISDTTTIVTTTTTDRYRTFLEDNRNIFWVSGSAVALLISTGLIIYIVWTCHGKNSCAQFKRTLFKRNKTYTKRPRPLRDRHDSVGSFTAHPGHDLPEQGSVRLPPPPVANQPWRRGL